MSNELSEIAFEESGVTIGRFRDDCAQCGEPECDCETLQTDRYQDGESPHNKENSPRDTGMSGGAT